MKSAVIAIVGRPSSGKSTLLNRLCGGKVSIVSPTPQTTRNRVRGILTTQRGQLVFIDTPGFHLSEKKLNTYLRNLVSSALGEVDLVLYVVDGFRETGEEERAIQEVLVGVAKPIIVALNKKDMAPGGWRKRRESVSGALPGAPLFEISAVTGEGVEALVDGLFAGAAEGEQLYPPDFYTDQPLEFRVTEIIREKAVNLTRQEVPHALYVKLEDVELKDSGKKLWVRGFILVERESQKGILVGRGGEKIKQIVMSAQEELSSILPYAVRLDIRVKVDKDWRKKDSLLRKLIQ